MAFLFRFLCRFDRVYRLFGLSFDTLQNTFVGGFRPHLLGCLILWAHRILHMGLDIVQLFICQVCDLFKLR